MPAAQLAIRIVDLSLRHRAEGLGEQPHHVQVARRDALLGCLREQVIAHQDCQRIADPRVQRGTAVARVRFVDDVVVDQAGGVQQLDPDRHMVQRQRIDRREHTPDQQRQRGPQAFSRAWQHRREHRAEHGIVGVGQRRERGLRARQSRLDERQDGANGVGLGVRGDGDLTHATASGMRSNAGNTRTLLAHSRSTSASNASPTVSARHLTVARTNAGSLR